MTRRFTCLTLALLYLSGCSLAGLSLFYEDAESKLELSADEVQIEQPVLP